MSNAVSSPTQATAASPDAALLALLAAPLDAGRIAAALAAVDIETVLRTGSTNTDLLGRFREQAPARPLVRVALEQTAGRGRHGRVWLAAPGSALLFSVAIPLAATRGVDSAVSLACGLAVADALEFLTPVHLKWPNDLLLDGGKLAGVLCELALDGTGQRTLIAGIGLNLTQGAAARVAIGQPVAALDAVVPLATLAVQREALLARIASAVIASVSEFDQRGFAPLRPRFLARFAHLGREVELFEGGQRIATGVAVDIDTAGRLMLLAENGTRSFAGGEVSLRPAARAG